MKRIRITHETEYHYKEPVTFGPHRALMRPREGHAVHIERGLLEFEPRASMRWLRDLYGNSVAILTFDEPARTLRILSEVDVDLYEDDSVVCNVESYARSFPFQYSAIDRLGLVPYRLPGYAYDDPALREWLIDLYRPGQLIDTFDLLNNLNTYIFESLKYTRREDPGVQLPHETLALGGGSCRDYAVLMMEAARHWGFGAQFVTGYIQMGEGQHGATHAWTEIYIPGAGWQGFDPTNNKLAGNEHISVAQAPTHAEASPLSGFWDGPADAFESMEVSVQVVAIEESPKPPL
jgi:transglutaminase-like putative cysteine protease